MCPTSMIVVVLLTHCPPLWLTLFYIQYFFKFALINGVIMRNRRARKRPMVKKDPDEVIFVPDSKLHDSQ